MEEGSSGRITRRQFVRRSGAVIGAAGLVSIGWPDGRLAVAAPAGSGLSTARADIYARLLEALALAPEARVADVSQGRLAMDRWYASAPAATRAYIDSVLDSLEREGSQSFRRLRAADRLALLRGWIGHRHSSGRDDPRGSLAAAAVVLGAPVTDPGTDTPAQSLNYLRP
jgi:hypothetical protein